MLTQEQRLLSQVERVNAWPVRGLMALIRSAGEGVADRNLLGVGEGGARHTHRAAAHETHPWRAVLVE